MERGCGVMLGRDRLGWVGVKYVGSRVEDEKRVLLGRVGCGMGRLGSKGKILLC